ncbi:MAG: hypothetical protein IKX20_09975 [Paludibacteraceae bacterium]|nr:hypothetical protein [Paludibacteraceae bacterium]
MKNYQDIQKTDIDVQNFNFLIVTATKIETESLHNVMSGTILRIVVGDNTYYLGHIGLYNIINVQCSQMGSLAPGGSSQTVNAALKEWSGIKAVIMVGICFGFDEDKQQIGDVIVSKSIRNYETRRVGKDCEIPRGNTYQADSCLMNAFSNLMLSWENIGIDDKKKNLIIGDYISGEQLVDNIEVREKLHTESPEAKAGEMEGNGLVASCESARKPWILVKAICDFADGNKSKEKEKKQLIAATSAVRCCEAALGLVAAYESIGISIATDIKQYDGNFSQHDKVENYDVLFELYRKDYAPYFLNREIDRTVESYLTSHSIWIYGESGVGKSTSISHALLSKNREIVLINMAGIPENSSLEEIFEWIYNEVAGVVGETSIVPESYQLCIKKIIELLDTHYSGQSVYVLVEEIPFSGESFCNFVNSFSSLVVSNKLTGKSADVHFVLSSIDNPIPYIIKSMQKIKSMVKFLHFDIWTEDECNSLIDLIGQNITVPHVSDRADMITRCGNLPRPIKSVFREVYQTGFANELDAHTINKILTRL